MTIFKKIGPVKVDFFSLVTFLVSLMVKKSKKNNEQNKLIS